MPSNMNIVGQNISNEEYGRSCESLSFLHVLCSNDPQQRKDGLKWIRNTFNGWLQGYGSPKDNMMPTTDPLMSMSFLVTEQLSDLLRLSLTCPFDDVRKETTVLLSELADQSIDCPMPLVQGPSYFIPHTKVVPVWTDHKDTNLLFVNAFLQNSRLENYIQLMGYHHQYLQCLVTVQQQLMRGEGPLTNETRNYIAIMAAARHQCTNLVNLQITEFILQAGDKQWLRGLSDIPQKILNLYQLNKLMAHRPWLITMQHIEELTKGKDPWTLPEVMQAVVIMAHFHSLSTFICGCGVSPEIDHEEGHTFRVAKSDSDLENGASSLKNSLNENGLGTLMATMKQMGDKSESNELSQQEAVSRYWQVGSQMARLPAAENISLIDHIKPFIQDPDFGFEDVASKNSTFDLVFRASDFSWEEHGFSLINHLYSDIAPLLDNKFACAYTFTYHKIGDKQHQMDTQVFRRAIWNYVHCIYNIWHDDYDYDQIRLLLDVNLQSYIKNIVCFPERTSQEHYDSCMKEFLHSEKVHANIVALEARMQAELLYCIKAIKPHMT